MEERRAGIAPSMVYAEAVKGTVFPEWNKEISKRQVTLNVPLGQLEGWIFMAGELANNFALSEKELGMDNVTKKILSRGVRRENYKEHVKLFAALLSAGVPRFYPDLKAEDDLGKMLVEGFASGRFGDLANRDEVVAVSMPLGVVRTLVTSMAYQSSTILSMWENADINRRALVDDVEFACRSLADILSQLKGAGVKVETQMLSDVLLVVNMLDAM